MRSKKKPLQGAIVMDQHAEQRAQQLVEMVFGQLEPRVRELQAQERQAEERIQALRFDEERVRGDLHALQARIEEKERQVEQLRQAEAMVLQATAGATDVLAGFKATLEAEIVRLRNEVATLQGEIERHSVERSSLEGQIGALRQQLAALQEEHARKVEGLGAERARLSAEIGELEARSAEAREVAAADEARARAAREAANEAELWLARLRNDIAEASQQMAQVRSQAEALGRHYEELQRMGRPLSPYSLPEELPAWALTIRKVGTQLLELDYLAADWYAEAANTELRGVFTEALRNYLPHQAYDEAIVRREELTKQATVPVRTSQVKGEQDQGKPGRRGGAAAGSDGGSDQAQGTGKPTLHFQVKRQEG